VRITDRRTSESGQKLLGNDMQHLVIRPKLLKRRVCALASLRTDRGMPWTASGLSQLGQARASSTVHCSPISLFPSHQYGMQLSTQSTSPREP
jgi:hypothetical protein